MSLRGLQPFDNTAMGELIEEYNGYRSSYQAV
jgi:hypothetical protein